LDRLRVVFVIFSAVSFLTYGTACFLHPRMKQEFERYGFGPQRTIIGGLQVLAAVGLLAGFSQPWMGKAAAGGLALMMLVAVAVRIKIRDSFLQTLPAITYLGINGYLCWMPF